MVATADAISKASDTQSEFYEATLQARVQNVVLESSSDYVIGVVGEASSGKNFTLFGTPFNTQLCDLDYTSRGYDSTQLKLIETQLEDFNKKMTQEMVGIIPRCL